MENKQTDLAVGQLLTYETPELTELGKLNTLIRGIGSVDRDVGCPGGGGILCGEPD